MADALSRLLAELDASAATLRSVGSQLLPPTAIERMERRAAAVSVALQHGEPLAIDQTDELLSVEGESGASAGGSGGLVSSVYGRSQSKPSDEPSYHVTDDTDEQEPSASERSARVTSRA